MSGCGQRGVKPYQSSFTMQTGLPFNPAERKDRVLEMWSDFDFHLSPAWIHTACCALNACCGCRIVQRIKGSFKRMLKEMITGSCNRKVVRETSCDDGAWRSKMPVCCFTSTQRHALHEFPQRPIWTEAFLCSLYWLTLLRSYSNCISCFQGKLVTCGQNGEGFQI